MSSRELSFDELQEGLAEWSTTSATADQVGGTILAIPSLSLPYFGSSSEQLLHYEERIFYLSHFLKNPLNRLIVVTSTPIAETLVSYLLHLLPGVPHSHARRRIQFFHVQDHSAKPLTQKILERPALMHRLRTLLHGQPRATISCYTVTELEQRLAEKLQVPVYGPRAEHLQWATKSGARAIFRSLRMNVAQGAENLNSLEGVAKEMVRLVQDLPDLTRVVLKHNYSLSGFGNAIVDLEPLKRALSNAAEVTGSFLEEVAGELPRWARLAHLESDWARYWERFQSDGGVIEAFVEGDPCSVQVRIAGPHSVDVIATHDEITGGEDGQAYVGCRFPAHSRVAGPLAQAGLKVGKRLAGLGVVGRFDVDFLAAPAGTDRAETLYALDVNLRKGNTTFPIRTLQLLSGGSYDAEEGLFRGDPSRVARGDVGRPLYYLSSDHFGGGMLKGMLPRDLLEIITSSELHYSTACQTGALFHMLGGLSRLGKVGITCIARSHTEAEEMSRAVFRELLSQREGHSWIV